MSKEFLKSLLGDLYTDAIGEKLGDKELAIINDGSYIPRQKFSEKDQEAKDLKKQLDQRDTQLKELETKATGNEALQKQIHDLQEANKQAKQDFDAQLAAQAKTHAIDQAIAGAKGKNAKLIRAALDLDKIKLDGDSLLGFDDQIKALQESDGYLFDTGQSGTVGKGSNPPNGSNTKTTDEQIEDAIKAGDIGLSIRLKNEKYFKE